MRHRPITQSFDVNGDTDTGLGLPDDHRSLKVVDVIVAAATRQPTIAAGMTVTDVEAMGLVMRPLKLEQTLQQMQQQVQRIEHHIMVIAAAKNIQLPHSGPTNALYVPNVPNAPIVTDPGHIVPGAVAVGAVVN
jgi:hypothetical protein